MRGKKFPVMNSSYLADVLWYLVYYLQILFLFFIDLFFLDNSHDCLDYFTDLKET